MGSVAKLPPERPTVDVERLGSKIASLAARKAQVQAALSRLSLSELEQLLGITPPVVDSHEEAR